MPISEKSRRCYDAKPESSSVELVSPRDIQGAPVVLALAYWERLRAQRAFPPREELSPRGMSPFLRNMVLVRVLDGGSDYEYRIAGDAYVQAFESNFAGQRLSAIEAMDPDYGAATRAVYEHVRNVGQPFALRGWIPQSQPSRFSYHETVFLPLGKDGVVDHLMTATEFAPRAAQGRDVANCAAILPSAWKDRDKI